MFSREPAKEKSAIFSHDRSPDKSYQEQHTEQAVDRDQEQVRRMNAMLRVQHNHRCDEAEFFKNRWNHHRTQANGISRDDEKRYLPRQTYAYKSIEKSGMSDGWRILPANHVEHEIKRGENDDAPHEGDIEGDLSRISSVFAFSRNFKSERRDEQKVKTAPNSITSRRSPSLRFGGRTNASVPTRAYSPPTVRPSIRIVGQATDPRNSRSFAISAILKNSSFRFPATVISSTGNANSPF